MAVCTRKRRELEQQKCEKLNEEGSSIGTSLCMVRTCELENMQCISSSLTAIESESTGSVT
jgi:hypothetical protein